MQYTQPYHSPIGDILLAADDIGLTGLWFEGQKYFARGLSVTPTAQPRPVFDMAEHWLDLYFSGQNPDFAIPLHLTGTAFQTRVWTLLQRIPYGQTSTYGALAEQLGIRSARAVGSAVGCNPISILVPCHRVLGADGSLTGYAGGIGRKIALLQLEGIKFNTK